jgi:hypothetical protein
MDDNQEIEIQKNKGGRPKGSKDSLKRASPYVRAQARALYVSGHNPEDISIALNIKDVKLVNTWATRENWGEERDRVLSSSYDGLLQVMQNSQAEEFSGLKLIKDKSITAIRLGADKKGGVSPTKFSEATSAFMSALEIEYRLKTEALQVSFLNDVAQVLKVKIQDRQLLSEIGESLRDVLDKYRNKRLPSAARGESSAES